MTCQICNKPLRDTVLLLPVPCACPPVDELKAAK
jgi:hypothetical protein